MTSASDADVASPRPPGRLARLAGWATANQYVGVLVLLVCLVVVFSIQEPRFLTVANIRVLLTGVAVLWMVSLGLTVVMLTGGFDLSLGSMLALSGFIFVGFYLHLGVPALAAVLLTVVAGALIGSLVNGFLIGWLGMPFLVVTIGTLSLYQGITYLVSNGETTSITSSLLDSIGFDNWLGVPITVWIMIGTLIVALFVLRMTYFGRDVYATGGNATAARLAGVRVRRRVLLAYALTGALVGLAAIFTVAKGTSTLDQSVGSGLELAVIAATVIGGTSIMGGRGSVLGTVLGALLVQTVASGVTQLGWPSQLSELFVGIFIIVAVGTDLLRQRARRAAR